MTDAPVSDDAPVTRLGTDLDSEEASQEIAEAVKGRRSIARRYVLRLRRRHPDATPADIISLLERHYATSITTAGGVLAVGALAANVAIALIPGGGIASSGAKSIGQHAAKKVTKQVVKASAKKAALGVATVGATKAASLLPAGDEQIQFEITAIFALALADIHGMDLDHDQAHALVYGLSNEHVSQRQIEKMAKDVAQTTPDGTPGADGTTASGNGDWSHWANILADALPAGGAQTLVQTIKTGNLDKAASGLTGRQQTLVEYGAGAVSGGVTRFVFGRDVIASARKAFSEAPSAFPEHLAVPPVDAEDSDEEGGSALSALEDAARATGTWFSDTAGTVGGGVARGAGALGSGVAEAASSVTRPFRATDLDGDGVVDQAQALSVVKNAKGAIVGAAGSAGSSVRGLFRGKNRE